MLAHFKSHGWEILAASTIRISVKGTSSGEVRENRRLRTAPYGLKLRDIP